MSVPVFDGFVGDTRWSQRDFGGAVITVTRTGGTDGRVLVDYAMQDGTATNGVDYAGTSGTLEFDDFQTSASFVVTLLSGNTNFMDKTVQLVLSNPRAHPDENPAVIVPTLANSSASLMIREVMGTNINGGTNFSIEKVHYYVEESPRVGNPFGANSFVVVDVLLPAGGPGDVDYDIHLGIRAFFDTTPGSDLAHADTRFLPSSIFTDGTVNIIVSGDYVGGTRRLSFGQGETRMSITNFILSDSVVEFNEDFDIILRRAGNNQPPIGGNPRAKVTILYEDPPAGSVDREWNPDGVSTTTPRNNPTPGANNIVRAVALQEDQKTVIVGDFTAYNSNPRNRIARINTDGSHDATFNPGSGADDSVDTVAIYPSTGTANDGKIVIGGGFTSVNNIQRGGVARLNINGTLDNSFSPGSGANGGVRSVAIQSDGKVLIGGDFTQFNGVVRRGVARLNVNGSLDTSFNPGSGADGPVWSVAVQDAVGARSIFIGGEFLDFNGLYRGGIARLNDDGTTDLSFDAGGGADGPVYALMPQADGRLLIGGAFSSVDFRARSNLARLDATGALDLTFDPGAGANDAVYSIALQPDGKLLVGGLFTSFNQTRRMGLARLFVNGTVDTSFLDTAYNQFAGLIKTYHYEPANYVNGIALQTNGGVMIGGSFTQIGGNSANELHTNRNTLLGGTSSGYHWTRAEKRARYNVARLFGGSTIGPGNVEFVYAENGTDENSGTVSVALRRRDGRVGTVGAFAGAFDNLALDGQDYQSVIIFPFWVAPGYINTNNVSPLSLGEVEEQYFDISILDDSLVEGDELVDLAMGVPYGDLFLGGEYIPLGAALGQSSGVLTIVDNDFPRGVFAFSSASYVTNENAGFLRVTVVRTNGNYGQVTVRFFTLDGSATNGVDYTSTQGTLTFNGTSTSQSFNIPILNDNFVELDKSFSIILTNATGAGATNMLGPLPTSTRVATATIIDNDYQPGRANFASAGFNISESTGVAEITLVRLGGSIGQLSVSAAATDGSAQSGLDFTATTNTITWVDGDVAPKTFFVTFLDDSAVEGNETIGLRIFDAFPINSIGSVSNATLTVVEDDLFGSLSFSQAFFDADERGTNVTITVIRTGGLGGTLTVDYSVANGTAISPEDFLPASGTLTFGPGVMATSFEVVVNDNGLGGGDRFATNVLSNLRTNGVVMTPGVVATSELRIIDDETIGDPAGSLDTTFNPLAGGTNAIHALALQPDGSLLVGGEFRTLNRTLRNRIGRLNPDGTLDATFNPLGGPNAPVRAVALQPDGRVVIGGFFDRVHTTNRNHIARLLADGSVDGFFNPGAGADNPVYAVAIHPDGRVIMGGSFTTVNGISRAGVALLEPNGVVSPSFAPGTGADGTVFAVAIQPDGKILIGGDFTTFNGSPQPRLARLNVNGSVDVTFDVGTGPSGPVRAIALQPDGKILIGGSFTNVNGTARGRLARLDASGALDAPFMSAVEGGNLDVTSISVQFDGKIIVAGEFTLFNGVSRNRITRLYRNGKTDPTINFGEGANDIINTTAIQNDRKIVIGGRFTAYDGEPRSFLARIHGGSIAGAGSFRFSSPNFDTTENAGQAVITVQRRGGLTADVTVDYRTFPGSATAGSDYTSVSGTLSFFEGETRQTFMVPILNDFVGETNETVLLVLTNVTGGATLGTIPNATLTIVNDDSGVGFSSASYAVNEGVVGGTVLITVVRTGATNGTATVNYTTASGTATAGQDYSTRSGVLTFAPGVLVQTFSVPIMDDQLIELSEMFNLQLSNLTGGGALNVAAATVTIVDNDFQTGDLTFAESAYSVAESGGSVTVTVLRTNGSTGVITVDYATVAVTALAGNDYTAQSGTLTFAEGQTSQSILVPILDDASVEGDEVFVVQIFNPGGGTVITGPTNVFVTIEDEEIGPGSLDRTFDPGMGANNLVRSVVVQSDGKLMVGGAFTSFNGTNLNYLARLMADGLVDTSFDPGAGPNGMVVSLSSMADGRAVIGGAFTLVDGSPYKFVSRLLSDGAADANFTPNAGFNGSVHAVRAQPDGRMLVGGSFALPTRGFVQLRLDGSVDTTFNPGLGANGPVHAFAVQPDGRVLLAGAFTTVDGLPRLRVARVNADGSLDGSFMSTAITNGTVYALVLQSSGQVVVAGDFQTTDGTNSVRIARLNTDGSLDGSFNVGAGANDVVFTLGANAADQLLVGGSFTTINNTNRNRFARLNADGSLDLSFDPGPGANGTVYSLALLPSGDFIIGGDFTVVSGTPRNRLARILGGGVAPLPLRLQSASASGGQFQMVVASQPGLRCVLEASVDLRSWLPVQTNIATGATTIFTHSNMSAYSARFFRVRQLMP